MSTKEILKLLREKAARLKNTRKEFQRECADDAVSAIDQLLGEVNLESDHTAASIKIRRVVMLLAEAGGFD